MEAIIFVLSMCNLRMQILLSMIADIIGSLFSSQRILCRVDVLFTNAPDPSNDC